MRFKSATVAIDIPTLPHIKKGDRVNIEFFSYVKDASQDGRMVAVYKAWRPENAEKDAFFLFERALEDFGPLEAVGMRF